MSTLKVGTIADTSGSNGSTPAAIANGIAKAWVNFDGTGTVAIRASFNVSSITDNGTGNYTVNFTNAFADTNYTFHIQCRATVGNFIWGVPQLGASKTTSEFTLTVIQSTAGGLTDSSEVNVAVFR